MSGEQVTGLGLSPDEQAFFDSRGEAAPAPEKVEPAAETEAPTPATGEEAEGEDQDEQELSGDQHRVPRGVVIAERKRRQEAERQRAEFEQQLQAERELNRKNQEQWARADERLRLLMQPQQQEEQPSGIDELATFAPDAAREVAEIKAWRAEQQRAAQEQAQFQQVVGAYQAKVQEFTQKQPDFMDAYKHVRETRAKQLEVQGYSGAELQEILHHDEMSFAVRALRQGVNPGERLYALATQVYGYAPKAADPPPDTGALIDAKADTVARSKSLSQVGGQATPRAVNAKALADMSDDDFEAFMSKGGSKAFRRALNS